LKKCAHFLIPDINENNPEKSKAALPTPGKTTFCLLNPEIFGITPQSEAEDEYNVKVKKIQELT
jgi:hypothetical protein